MVGLQWMIMSHIISRTSYYELRQIRVIRRTLSLNAAAVQIHSFVVTRLDYCNGVLLDLPEFRLHQLQLVQNAARLLADLPKYSHISDYMRRDLHWLSVADRVKFKIATLVWKATTDTAPDYIAELCLPVGTQTGRRALRSASRNDLMNHHLCSSGLLDCGATDLEFSSAVCACSNRLYGFL